MSRYIRRMADASSFRDSTEIRVPCDSLEGLREDLETEFTVTVFSRGGDTCRIIGSPTEIRAVSGFLSRHGVSIR